MFKLFYILCGRGFSRVRSTYKKYITTPQFILQLTTAQMATISIITYYYHFALCYLPYLGVFIARLKTWGKKLVGVIPHKNILKNKGLPTEKKKQPSLQSSLNAPFHQGKLQASIANPNRKFLRIFPPSCRLFSPFFWGGKLEGKKNKTSMWWGYGPECLCSSSTEVLCHYQDPKTWPARRKCNGKSGTHPFGIVGGVKYTLNIEHEVVNLDEYRTYVKHWDMSKLWIWANRKDSCYLLDNIKKFMMGWLKIHFKDSYLGKLM